MLVMLGAAATSRGGRSGRDTACWRGKGFLTGLPSSDRENLKVSKPWADLAICLLFAFAAVVVFSLVLVGPVGFRGPLLWRSEGGKGQTPRVFFHLFIWIHSVQLTARTDLDNSSSCCKIRSMIFLVLDVVSLRLESQWNCKARY